MLQRDLRAQYFVAFVATFGSFVFGTSGGWPSPVLPQLRNSFTHGGLDMNEASESWVGGLMPVGALVGGPVAGVLVDLIGRKHTMLVTAVLFSLSYPVLVISPSITLVYCGRASTGVCTGMASLVCPLYVAETARPDVRGYLGSWVQLMVTVGVLASYSLGAIVTWRWLSVICIAFSLIWTCILLLIPETPSYQVTKGFESDAKASLTWLRGAEDQRDVLEELEDVKESVILASSNKSGFTIIFERTTVIPLMIGLLLMFAQQFSGISVVICYTDEIFADAGSSLPVSAQTIVIGGAQVVATFIGALLMDRLGRRFLLLLSSIVMVVSICMLGTFFFIKHNLNDIELADKLSILPIVALSVYIAAFSIGLGPIPWLMMSELFSPSARGLASSIVVCSNWSLCFITIKFFPGLKLLIGMAITFWALGAILMLSTVLIFLIVPETKGKSLEEIQRLFDPNS